MVKGKYILDKYPSKLKKQGNRCIIQNQLLVLQVKIKEEIECLDKKNIKIINYLNKKIFVK